jgi:NADH-quinone oxidoreductase subunit J
MIIAVDQLAQHVGFMIIAAVVIFGALRVVTANNVVHAALYLVAVLAATGASFLLLGAEFVGITQILVYVGAIVVLFLFGIMLTRAPIGTQPQMTARGWWVGALVALAIAGVLGYTLIDAFGNDKLSDDTLQSTAAVSDSIFSTYLIPFEVVSVLLLAALVGAIVLARKE